MFDWNAIANYLAPDTVPTAECTGLNPSQVTLAPVNV